jgi:DNA polymerase-1
MKNAIIIDGDTLVYRASSAVQQTFAFKGPVQAVTADFVRAMQIVDREIAQIRRATDADDVVIALSDADTSRGWRRLVLPSYKAQRNPTARPVLYKQIRMELQSRFNTKTTDFLEGDDTCGLWATKPGHPERMIVGEDKDFLGVPGRLYRPHRAEQGIITITPEAADRWHLLQTLAGDPVDGYKGIVGIGMKKAAAILDAEVPKGLSPWGKVVAAYRRHGLTDQDALTQARVARILRWGDWNREVGVKLWLPQEQQETT